LQAFVEELAELFAGNFGAADLGNRRARRAAEHVADAPDREAHDQKGDDGKHDRLADPVR
jgi:hypothetical protein